MGSLISKIKSYDFIYDTKNKHTMCERCWSKLSRNDIQIEYKLGVVCSKCDRDIHPEKYFSAFRDFK